MRTGRKYVFIYSKSQHFSTYPDSFGHERVGLLNNYTSSSFNSLKIFSSVGSKKSKKQESQKDAKVCQSTNTQKLANNSPTNFYVRWNLKINLEPFSRL